MRVEKRIVFERIFVDRVGCQIWIFLVLARERLEWDAWDVSRGDQIWVVLRRESLRHLVNTRSSSTLLYNNKDILFLEIEKNAFSRKEEENKQFLPWQNRVHTIQNIIGVVFVLKV